MSDEIDIEEHDVMDNPTIRRIFPDLSVIKQEINQYYEEGSDILADIGKEVGDKATSSLEKNDNLNEGTVTEQLFNEDIDSKPSIKSDADKVLSSSSLIAQSGFTESQTIVEDPDPPDKNNEGELIKHENVIILGSKPSRSSKKQNIKSKITKQPKILLENISHFLNASKRYCSKCLILFPKPNMFTIHKYNVHTLKMPKSINDGDIDSNSQTIKQTNTSKEHVCFHCDTIFPTQRSLIEHLYDILDPTTVQSKSTTNLKVTSEIDQKGSKDIERPDQPKENLEKDYYLKQLLNKKSKFDTFEQNKNDYYYNIITTPKNISPITKKKFNNNPNGFNQYYSNRNKIESQNKDYENHQASSENDKSNQKITTKTASKRKHTDNVNENYSSKKKADTKITDSSNQSINLEQSKKVKLKGSNTAEKCKSNFSKLSENSTNEKKTDKKMISDSSKSNQKEIKDSKVLCKTQKDDPIFEDVKLYKCFVCSKYHMTYRYYSKHMREDHNMKEVPTLEKVEFDPICQFCKSSVLSDYKSYNNHLLKFHKNELRKAVLPPNNQELHKTMQQSKTLLNIAFKSILFKCVKCEIFCLTVDGALRHYEDDHVEPHNSWTCANCQKKFKMKYKPLHLQQHTDQLNDKNTFTVYTLNESEICRVLYKCSQCAVHYSENNFINHNTKCDLETPDSLYCKVCDILINREDMNFHEIIHKGKRIQYSDFTVIESEVIFLKKSKNSVFPKTPQENYHFQNSTKYAFCTTCECFVSITCNKTLMRQHYNAECNVSHKTLCKKCGIIITSGASPKHAHIHEKIDINLQDLIFYDLRSKMQICPPVPKYPHCKRCAIHFLAKKTLQEHLCDKQQFKTCDICLIKLTNQAYKLHMQFHSYSIQKVNTESKLLNLSIDLGDDGSQTSASGAHIEGAEKSKFIMYFCETCKCFISTLTKFHREGKCGHIPSRVCKDCGLVFTPKFHDLHKELHKKEHISLQNFIFYDMNKKFKKRICPPIPEYPHCNNCGVHFLNIKEIKGHICNKQEYLTCKKCSMKLTEHAFKLHTAFHNYSINKSKRKGFTKSEHESKNGNLSQDSCGNMNVDETKHATILYACKSCEIRLNTYDRIVQHCQDHYDCNLDKINTQKCMNCNLLFEVDDYNYHNDLHSNGKFIKESVNVIDFDPFYFRFNCSFWTKHVFAYVADEEIRRILHSSMYKYECRLKMIEIQSGLSGLTLYECDKCSVCIEPHMIFNHAVESINRPCANLPNYLCNICGISFDSLSYRDAHQQDHKNNKEVNLTSFTIIVFNKIEHDNYSKIMFESCNNFILYQCRHCDRIVEKFLRNTHVCELNNLVKCLKCGLLLHKDDYDVHFIRHEELDKFDDKNIIVVMFGKIGGPFKKKLKSSFTGTIHDYTFYKCNNCELCIKSQSDTLSHICVLNNTLRKCPKCGLNFLTNEIECHSKLHESAVELDKFTLNLVTFDPPSQLNPQKEKVIDSRKKPIDVKTNKSVKEKSNNCSQLLERLFKCNCGLHFMEELNAQQHANSCNVRMKISKQSCFKCDLLFTPGELFNHLLKHHCDKKIQCKFDIVMIHKKG